MDELLVEVKPTAETDTAAIVKEIFTNLVNIDVSKFTKKKMNLTYLPWADAYRILIDEYPGAQIREHWFDENGNDITAVQEEIAHIISCDTPISEKMQAIELLKTLKVHPYLKSHTGYFTVVGVIIKGIEKIEKLPVLDKRNKSIEQPDSFDINTTTKRCWVKAMAQWGLGLYIYAGEDVPDTVEKATPPNVKPAQVETITDEQKTELTTLLETKNLKMDTATTKMRDKFKIERPMPTDISKLSSKQAAWLIDNIKQL